MELIVTFKFSDGFLKRFNKCYTQCHTRMQKFGNRQIQLMTLCVDIEMDFSGICIFKSGVETDENRYTVLF